MLKGVIWTGKKKHFEVQGARSLSVQKRSHYNKGWLVTLNEELEYLKGADTC